MIIQDDYSRGLWTILLPNKQHTSKVLQDFYCYVQTQFKWCIKRIRTYNGREFVNTELTSFFSKFSIIHQTTCPYTPQQNGRIERRHINLLEMTRALLFRSHLPTSFWDDCLLTSTYLINRLPNSKLHFKTPMPSCLRSHLIIIALKLLDVLVICFYIQVTN